MNRHAAVLVLSSLAAVGCADDGAVSQADDLTSKSAIFLELSFHGETIGAGTESPTQLRKSVVSQLFYLAGELDKVHGGHGRFGYVELENVQVEPLEGGLERIVYDAKLPVAWPKHRAVPETYRVVAPLRVDPVSLDAFNTKYAGRCGEAHYGAEYLWYDFEPVTSGCAIDEGDVIDTVAKVAPSPYTTIDKRPELERFWDDGVFRAVVVHGTDSSWGKDENDTGVRQYLAFQDKLKSAYPDGVVTEGPTSYGIFDDWTFEVEVPSYGGGSGKLVVTTLLTSSLESIGSDFDERFAALSPEADLITYGGHSGLSANIKAIAAKEKVQAQHYQVYFLDGCSTFAYLDTTLTDARIAINGEELDPHGTKFLDVIVNAQPAPWYTGAASQWTVLSSLSGSDKVSYLDILDELSQSATPVVAGEEDNPSIDE